ncbi:MAG: ATP-binding protein [Verrucomicrobia bacterium]|nr:ATP-binding protein [Verrucomicrobiota bacterium]
MNRDERRLYLQFGAILVVLLLLAGLAWRELVARTLRAETPVQLAFLDLALRDRSRYLAETLQPLRQLGNWPENLADILTRNHADFNRDIFLQVFEPSGELIAASQNAPEGLSLASTAQREGRREVRWMTDETTFDGGRKARLVTYPVYLGDPRTPDVRILGFAQAGLPLPDTARSVARFTWMFALGLAALGLGVMLVLRLAISAAAGRLARESAAVQAAQHRFVGDAAHELGTPLAILRGEIDLALRRERTPDEYRAALVSCREEIERLARLSESLLVLATADAGQELVRRVPGDAAALARAVHARFQRLAREKQVTLVLKAPDSLAWTTDALAVEQILGNLLSNALRHTPRGESVELEVGEEGDQLVFRVSDTGEGIPSAHLPRLFERFHRVDQARSRSAGGAGLGLAIVRTLVQALDGQIEVTSELGKGSTFTCRFPRGRNEDATPKVDD